MNADPLGGAGMLAEILVYVVLAAHYIITLVPPFASFAVARWPVLVFAHLPMLAWAFWAPLGSWPCPLTDLEKALRLRAGMPGYEGFFVEHHVWRHLGDSGPEIWRWFNLACVAAGYSLLLVRVVRGRPERAA